MAELSDDHEVSDEDESAEANEGVQQEKQKKKSKLKLNRNFSNTVGMKSIHFHSTGDSPKGMWLGAGCFYTYFQQ